MGFLWKAAVYDFPYCICVVFAVKYLRSYMTFLGQAKFTFNFLPKKSIRVPVETVISGNGPFVPFITGLH